MRARSVSRWVLTETYSPAAMLSAPATRPATPATKIASAWEVAPATPITMPATDTMPSLAPSTAARNALSRPPMPSWCGSSSCGPIPSGATSVSELMPPWSQGTRGVATKDCLPSALPDGRDHAPVRPPEERRDRGQHRRRDGGAQVSTDRGLLTVLQPGQERPDLRHRPPTKLLLHALPLGRLEVRRQRGLELVLLVVQVPVDHRPGAAHAGQRLDSHVGLRSGDKCRHRGTRLGERLGHLVVLGLHGVEQSPVHTEPSDHRPDQLVLGLVVVGQLVAQEAI